MALTNVPKQQVIEALIAQWDTIDHLVTPLSDEQWAAPSGLPGWSVGDVVAHVAGTEMMLDGREPDATGDAAGPAHVRNPIGELNERWVEHYRGRGRDELMADYRDVTARRAEALTAMSDDEFAAETMTPVGWETYGRFMRVRVFDCWVHEIDIRDALGIGDVADPRPAEFAAGEMIAVLPFVLGKVAQVPRGKTVTLEFEGVAPRTAHVEVGERATLADDLAGLADVTLRLDVADYARLIGARPKAHAARVVIDGDEELGTAIIGRLNYLI